MIRVLDSTHPEFDRQLAAALAYEEDTHEGVEARVAEIVRAVRTQGDAALLEYTQRFDRVTVQQASAL